VNDASRPSIISISPAPETQPLALLLLLLMMVPALMQQLTAFSRQEADLSPITPP